MIRDPELIRIGTRASALALRQSSLVREALLSSHPGLRVEIVHIKSHGDIDRDTTISAHGMTGVFTRRLEQALIDGTIDVAVHSLKDLPSQLSVGLTLAAFLPREDARDVLISDTSSTMASLPEAPLVATGSPRRRAQVLLQRPRARFVEIRGNIETRIARFRESDAHAMILAAAGLHRLRLGDCIASYLEVGDMVPAPGQGIIAVECRDSDVTTRDLTVVINHKITASAASAERSMMTLLQSGCQAPMGAYAVVESEALTLRAVVLSPDAAICVRRSVTGHMSEAVGLGHELARHLIADGATDILAALRSGPVS